MPIQFHVREHKAGQPEPDPYLQNRGTQIASLADAPAVGDVLVFPDHTEAMKRTVVISRELFYSCGDDDETITLMGVEVIVRDQSQITKAN